MSYDALCNLADVKEWLTIKPTDETQDDQLSSLIESCSAQIGQFCGRDNLGEVITYSENYRTRMSTAKVELVLRHYPVTSLTSIMYGGTAQTILTASQLQANQTNGWFLEDDQRTLVLIGAPNLFAGFARPGVGYLQVNYTAGYSLENNGVPQGLRQAAIQFIGEIYESSGWIGFKSKSLAGETVSFEGGAQWSMSPRTKSMLQPYVNRIPTYV